MMLLKQVLAIVLPLHALLFGADAHGHHHGHERFHARSRNHEKEIADPVAVEARQSQNIASYRLWTREQLEKMKPDLPARCINMLAVPVRCNNATSTFQAPGYAGWPGSDELTNAICTTTCGTSLASYYKNVEYTCKGYSLLGAVPQLLGGRVWNGWNQTCLRDTTGTRDYCGKIISDFTVVSSKEKMPKQELCSFCWLEHFRIMQRSSYSGYDDFFKSQLDYAYKQCGVTGDTSVPPLPVIKPIEEEQKCMTGETVITKDGDTCDSIAMQKHVTSQGIYSNNAKAIVTCDKIKAGRSLCLPASCEKIYKLQEGDTCNSIESQFANTTGVSYLGAVRKFNKWVNTACDNLQWASDSAFGHVLCMSPPNGKYEPGNVDSGTVPAQDDGYTTYITPAPTNATIAEGTTLSCGIWYFAGQEAETCNTIVFGHKTTIEIFLEVNPSLGSSIPDCTQNLQAGSVYCAKPYSGWKAGNQTNDIQDDGIA